jgi:uncharacterized membrane protein
MDEQDKIPGPLPRHPALLAAQKERAESAQLRLADRITRYAGSMGFVHAHAAVFAIWMLAFERRPWPTLTLAVSLEAIFLSTFVMIGQNRQAAFQQANATTTSSWKRWSSRPIPSSPARSTTW